MRLNSELARKIVEKTMSVLGKNINIMDHNGIIIASGDQKRIDTFHEIAAKVIEEGTIIVGEGEVKKYKGVKAGINLPITFNNEIIGVVGITGKIAEVEGYGKIVKNMVELMLQQELLYREINRKNKVRENFYQQLLSNDISNLELLKDRAKLLKIKFNLPRIVLVIRLKSFNNETTSKKIQQICSKPYDREDQDVLLIKGEDLVLIKTLLSDQKEQNREVKRLVKEIENKCKREVIIGVGQIFERLDQLHLSYQGGKHALEVGEKIYSKEKNRDVFYLNQLGYDYFLPFIPEDHINYYLHNLFNHDVVRIFSETNIGELIEALCKNNLNISKTAEELSIHRNTLLYKLKDIKRMTGIDPKEVRGLFILLLAYHLYLYRY
ncbi:hypothetical protein U472_11415 [Orenia metallireducens]|jgi:carbohydrate diacid regulator|uniref:Carbohydrate diacid regulator n=1 Tax=Orenia metallireducens TaxID=1413210 RepID=A0A1C0A8M7_9FIRM|nr:sugar diacid recognition domain-containing protein [Orenia metallireducens]OCL26587.1 hypothetical protein U472_11415 [Orenia metallireducens]